MTRTSLAHMTAMAMDTVCLLVRSHAAMDPRHIRRALST